MREQRQREAGARIGADSAGMDAAAALLPLWGVESGGERLEREVGKCQKIRVQGSEYTKQHLHYKARHWTLIIDNMVIRHKTVDLLLTLGSWSRQCSQGGWGSWGGWSSWGGRQASLLLLLLLLLLLQLRGHGCDLGLQGGNLECVIANA